jgi:host factor-I protein
MLALNNDVILQVRIKEILAMIEIMESLHLQTDFLFELQNRNVPVSIFLVNGIRLLGYITGFDDCSIKLSHKESSQLVYKHCISTIVPDQEER